MITIMIMIVPIGDFVLNITLKCYHSAAPVISLNDFFAFSQSEGGNSFVELKQCNESTLVADFYLLPWSIGTLLQNSFVVCNILTISVSLRWWPWGAILLIQAGNITDLEFQKPDIFFYIGTNMPSGPSCLK